MRVIEELEALERKAIAIAAIPDRKLRQQGGRMLESQCAALDNQHRILGGFDYDAEISLRAILKIVFDYILYDALDDEDWQSVLPDHFDGDIEHELKEYKYGAP